MNKLRGVIVNVQQAGGVVLVDVDVNGYYLAAMLMEFSESISTFKIGDAVDVVFKETEVSLAKNLSGLISIRNCLDCIVVDVVQGELLSCVKLQFKGFEVMSSITSRSVKMLDVKIGDCITALVKANEMTLIAQ